MEFTIAILKPDVYVHRKRVVGTILQLGFGIKRALDVQLTNEQVRVFYSEHVDKDYFPRLLAHMTSGRSLVLKLECKTQSIVDYWRKCIGPTNPVIARQDNDHCLRAIYGTNLPMNAFHGSDSIESAICEAAVFNI